MDKKRIRNVFIFLFVVLWIISFSNGNYGNNDNLNNSWPLAADNYTNQTTVSPASIFIKSLLSVTSVHAGSDINKQIEEDLPTTNVKDTDSIYFKGEKLEKNKGILPNLGRCCSKSHSFWGCYQSWVWCY